MPDERTLAEFMILILSICSDKPAYVNLTLTGMSVLYQCVSEEFFCLAKSQSGKLRPLFYPFWIAQIINEGWCRSQETLVLAKQVKSLYMRHGAANQTNSNV